MDIYEALYTTRAMRRVKPDPIPLDVQARMMDAAIRAPSGGNMQGWRFLLADDPDVRGKIAPLYRECIDRLWATFYKDRLAHVAANPDEPDSIQMEKVKRSADWGRAGLEERVADAWHPFCRWIGEWLEVIPARGLEGARDAYLEVIEGGVDPRRAHVVSLT